MGELMLKYELTLIVNSSVKGEEKDKLVERIEKIVKALDGKVVESLDEDEFIFKLKEEIEKRM